MIALTRILGSAGLALAGTFAAAGTASATLCEEFTLTAVQVAVFENGSWSHSSFTETAPGVFSIARDPSWPSQVSLILRWDIDPGAHPAILPAAGFAPLPVYLDYQYVGDGFGTSFGAVAQVNGVSMAVGDARPVYFEMGVYIPETGCDLIRSAIATLAVTQWLQIDPGRIPELACQGPGCDLLVQRPGDIVIDPGRWQQVLPQQALPGQRGTTQQQGAAQPVAPQQLLPQLQLRN